MALANVARMATIRQRHGALAEAEVARHLAVCGWTVLATNVRLDGVEVDLLAFDPGPPRSLVIVEVRSLAAAPFGVPEERVDRKKVARLYRALAALGAAPQVPCGAATLPRRVDLIVVDRRPGRSAMRHLRGVEPP